MLQNDSEKAYIIDPNEKIAQAIFLYLVKIAQLVLVENREELGITARWIQGFGLIGRIDVSTKQMPSASTGTIETDEFGKFKPTSMDATQDVTQQL
ncbi:hypothetical protein G9A89_016552 [Geosiphon pyriformis]|nr:hypothetical protein G9A89_016552 [Geosiphon pyriformis]